MFEDARQDLIDALKQNKSPITVADAREAVGGGELIAESALNQYATTVERDGTEYVTAIENGPSFSFDEEAADEETDAEGSDSGAEESEPQPDQTPSPDPASAQRVTGGAEWRSDEDRDLYMVNGLRIATDPESMLVGEPTGDDYYGLPILDSGNDLVPNEPGTYMPIPVGGGRDSEEVIGRVQGVMHRPLLLEGDAGTGKNLSLDWFNWKTLRSKYRINFGSDVSVFDLVGEKDIVNGESYYILGKLAKPALFGGSTIFDEVNMVSGDTSSFVHSVTEKPGSRSLELRGTGITLTDLPVSQKEIREHGSWYAAARQKWDPAQHLGKYIHPEFRVTATCNPLGYADTKPMNDAFRDRFVVLEHPYLTEMPETEGPSDRNLTIPNDPPKGVKREAALLAEETGIDEGHAQALVDVIAVLREARKQANALSCPITHRSLLKTVELAGPEQEFMPFKDALQIILTGHAATQQDKQYVKDTLNDEL